MNKNKRPVFLNLSQVRLPVTGVVSIFHRITGLLLALAIPFFIYLFDLSVRSERGFQQALYTLGQPTIKIFACLMIWALAHHMIAGIRFLLIDADIGVMKVAARQSAWLVHALAGVIFVLGITVIWL